MKKVFFLSIVLLLVCTSVFSQTNSNLPSANTKTILLLSLFVFVLIFYRVSNYYEKKRTLDPLTSGSPAIPGGVKDQEIYSYFKKILGEKFPNEIFELKEIYKGFLSGDSILEYPEGKRKLIISLVPAYCAGIQIDGEYIDPICILQQNGVVALQGECHGFYIEEVIQEDGTTLPFEP